MKKSTAVTLVISGALMAGCDDQYGNNGWSSGNGQYGTNAMTNNTFVTGRGYWHAPYYNWYPYPYNYYRPGFGYFHGGNYSDGPETSPITRSSPRFSSSGGSHGWGSWFGSSSGSHFGISRGGFGGSAHGGS